MSRQIYISLLSAVRYLSCVKRLIYTNGILCGTHYETLKLPRNCTTKEVREAFIKLSKQCHPDKNQNDPNTHAQFVKLNEAYSILIRPEKRRVYDLTLKPDIRRNPRSQVPPPPPPYDVYTTAYRQRVVWKEGEFWEYQDKTKYDDDNYYGIKGIKRVANGYIALLCFIMASVGLVIQLILIRESTTFSRRRLDEQSQEASKVLAEVQQQALLRGNKKQLEILRDHIGEQSGTSNDSADISQPPTKSSKSSSTKNRPEHKPPQETSNISNITSIPNNMTHPCNMSGPNVIIIPDVETHNSSEESLWIKPALVLTDSIPHVLENENGHTYDLVINSVLEKESTDNLCNPQTMQNGSDTETLANIETVVPNFIHTELLEDVNSGVFPINYIDSPLHYLDLNTFELILSSSHDTNLTIHQNSSTDVPQEVTEQISSSDHRGTFGEFGNDHVPDDIFNCLGKTASTVDIEKAPKSSL